jgi:hypothetical protein
MQFDLWRLNQLITDWIKNKFAQGITEVLGLRTSLNYNQPRAVLLASAVLVDSSAYSYPPARSSISDVWFPVTFYVQACSLALSFVGRFAPSPANCRRAFFGIQKGKRNHRWALFKFAIWEGYRETQASCLKWPWVRICLQLQIQEEHKCIHSSSNFDIRLASAYAPPRKGRHRWENPRTNESTWKWKFKYKVTNHKKFILAWTILLQIMAKLRKRIWIFEWIWVIRLATYAAWNDWMSGCDKRGN